MSRTIAQFRGRPSVRLLRGLSARPGRRGLRSLAGHLVLLVLVPLIAAQALTITSLLARRTAANEARELTSEIDLTAVVGALYTPVAMETVASIGLAAVDLLGVDRSVIAAVAGLDWQPYLDGSRRAVDRGLDRLVTDHGDERLTGDRSVADEVASVRTRLQRERQALDAHVADPAALGDALDRLDQLVNDVARLALAVHEHPTIDPALGALADEMVHLLTLVDVVATDTKITSIVLGASTNDTLSTKDALMATGATDFVVDEYGRTIGAGDAAEWAVVMARFRAYEALRPQLITALELRSTPDDSNILFTDPDLIRSLAAVLLESFDRLEAVERFAEARWTSARATAMAIAAGSDDDVREWTGILVVLTMSSIGFLILVVTSTVRPLSRLTDRALLLERGVIDPEPLELSGPSDVRAVTETFNTVSGVLSAFEHQVRRLANGDTVDPVAADEVPGMLGRSLRAQVVHLADMTSRLRESEALSRAIVETAADAIWTVDGAGRVLSANAAAELLLDRTTSEQIGRSLTRLLGANGDVGDLTGELLLRRHDGVAIDVLVAHSEVPAEPEPIHAVFARDISDRKRFEQQLAQQARRDGLTDLPNRLAALEHLDLATRRAELHGGSVVVLFVDLDGFKSVNDSRGHASGDRLLHEVGARLSRTLRSGEFVARLGGDEFLVVCTDTTVDAAAALGERVIREIAQPYVNGDDLFTISASVGVAIAHGDAQEVIDGLELVREADVAVYHAKARGRSRVVVFDHSLQEAVEATAEIDLALRQAIPAGELVLHYQPVVDLATGAPWGVEALVRWNRPGHGLLAPDRFVPVAEQSSLVIELGRWVLLDACGVLADWQSTPARRHLRIAVNVSGRHLVEGNLVADLDDVIARTGVDPAGLEVELTETHLLADFERANLVLSALRDRGISVAVDDFGTGYSSMGYLRQLDIDALKIDKMFVARVTDIGYDRTIVEVLVQLGLTLGLDIVAEGVETPEQLAFVRTHRCTRAQGFHIARPMPLGDLDHWLDTHRCSGVAVVAASSAT